MGVVLGCVTAALLLSWTYFARVQITRPPLGVINLMDVALMLGAIVLVPYFYLLLPTGLVVGFLGLGALSALYLTIEGVYRGRAVVWLVTLALVGADLAVTLAVGAGSIPYFAVNNLVLVLLVVGTTNLWAQAGLKARDAAVLGAGLVVYDLVATTLLPFMGELVQRLAGLPFAPLIAWPVGGDAWLGVGLGDVLLAAVFPLVQRKAFGTGAGLLALGLAFGVIGSLFLLLALGVLRGLFPVMVVLGPAMVLQYGFWRWRRGDERTTGQYQRARGEPAPAAPTLA
jgi:hypothetical protein